MTKHNHSTVEIVLNPLFRTLSVQLSADKMGMKPNCICVGVCVGIGVGSVWTVLHITVEPIVVSDVVGNGDGDGIGQCEHTIIPISKHVIIATLLSAHISRPSGLRNWIELIFWRQKHWTQSPESLVHRRVIKHIIKIPIKTTQVACQEKLSTVCTAMKDCQIFECRFFFL